MAEIKSALKQTISKTLGKEKNTTTKVLDYAIIGAISLIFFFCPLFFTGFVAQGLGFEKMIIFYFLVLIGIVAWITKGVIIGELKIKRTPLDIPILVLIAAFSISTFLSINAKDSLIGSYGNATKSLVAIIIFVLFYYLVVNNINLKRIKIIVWSLVLSATLIIIYSLLQLFGIFVIPIDFTQVRNFNPIGSLSGLTMFIVAVLPLFLVLIAQIKEIHPKLNSISIKLTKIGLSLVALAGLTVLLLLNGFTFWPAAVLGVVIVLMFFLSKIIFVSSNNIVIPFVAFFLLIILLVLGNFNITDLGLPAEVSLSRGASWDIAKNALKENPIFGSGLATFYYDFSKFKGIEFNASPLWNVRFDNASGILFELMATVGTVGTLAFIVILLIALSISFLTLIKIDNKEIHSILLGLFASTITIIVFALLFSLNNSLLLIAILISALTLSTAVTLYPERFKSLKLSFRSSPKYALALAAIFLTVSAGVVVLFTMGLKMYLADIYARQSVISEVTSEKIEKLNKAVILFPYQDNYYLVLANNYMAIANEEAIGNQDQAIIENNLSQAIEVGKKAIELAPNKAANNESLALVYENASFYTRGALEWAEDLYNKLAILEPDNPVPHLRIALINMARANAETDETEQRFYINEAVKKYDEAISKKEDLSSAYYGKAIAEERLTNNDEAIEQLKRAVILARDNVDYRFELGRLYFNRGASQPNIAQNATQEITEEEINLEEGGAEGEDLSVQTNQPTGGVSARNDDLTMAEQIFLSILQLNPNHANALYSLGLLYQKIGETDNARIVVASLLNLLEDQATIDAVKQQFPGLY
ncbi:MAG: hypothetical protein ABIG60_00990 [Patescibacteria group bacterium]